MDQGYYHSCDYDLIGTCGQCLADHPGNWYVLLEDMTSCCVPSPEDVKAPRELSVNSTAGCPEVVFLKTASYGLGAFGVLACVGTMGLLARWIYRRWFAKKNNEAVNEIEMVAMGEAEGDGHLENHPGEEELPTAEERVDVCYFCEGYSADDESSSPRNSQGSLNMLAYETEDEFNLGGGLMDNDFETAV